MRRLRRMIEVILRHRDRSAARHLQPLDRERRRLFIVMCNGAQNTKKARRLPCHRSLGRQVKLLIHRRANHGEASP